MIPKHVLKVGQTIRLDELQETRVDEPSGNHGDPDLDVCLDNLNQLILELDPTFEPLRSPSCISPPADEDVSHCVLVPRGCPPCPPSTMVQSVSPNIPIPTHSSLSCSPLGTLVFSGSPSSSLPPLPCGSAPRRIPGPKQDGTISQGSLRLSQSNRNSATSLLSTSTCSDTSYILGSNLSLASEDADSPESISIIEESRTNARYSPDKPSATKQEHFQEFHSKGIHSSPASLSGSLNDIPLLLVNGAPQPDLHILQPSPGPQTQTIFSKSFSSHNTFNASQPSMKFVMDTSKFWFRPHISRAEADALIKDKEPGTFVIRDSTSYRGSFGLAMKVDQSPTIFSASAYPGESCSDLVRHFLIESSAKGVRIKGSSQEPYFGSLSALVYQHTICAYALPCKLLLSSQELDTTEDRTNTKPGSDDKNKTASNFLYLNLVPTEMLTGPCAVQRAVSSTLETTMGSFSSTIVNMKVSSKGVTLTDINRKLFFRRHYPAQLLSYSGEDPDGRRWVKDSSFEARMFGFVAKGIEAGVENVCHVFAEYDPLQPCTKVIEFIQAAIAKQ